MMMHTGSPIHPLHPHQNSQAIWQFAYGFQPLDLHLHPAFMHSPFEHLPLHAGCAPVLPFGKSKGRTFTIDAILSRDNIKDKQTDYPSKDARSEPTDRQIEAASRRYQRTMEVAHPYLQRHSSPEPYSDNTTKVTERSEKKCTNPATTEWRQTKGKRVRTIFTPEQLERLETEFERQQYMVGTERYYLASSLNLTEAQVKVWFQNRRIKWRKQHLEQQQAKLAKFDLYNDIESDSEPESEEIDSGEHAHS